MVKRIAADPLFGMTEEEINEILKPENFIGCSALQVDDFIENVIAPTLEKYKDIEQVSVEINV